MLAPTLFNVYISDMPETKSVKLGYADDWALSYQSKDWEELESVLSRDTTDLKYYFDKWYLKMNMTKTVSSVFHLNNKQAQNPLTITVDNKTLPIEREPKNLGVTLDRTLSYKAHIQGIAKKVNKRNCIIRKIAGTSWGAKQSVLRTSGLALCYSAAEYAAPVWSRISHTHQIDTKLRDTMRTISGCLKSTPNNWLLVTSAIAPPHLRREEANQISHAKIQNTESDMPIRIAYESAPSSSRLKSRNPFHLSKKNEFDILESWKDEWTDNTPRGGDLIQDPTERLPGFNSANRKAWVMANRIRTRHGRTAANLHKWGFIENPTCPRCNGPHMIRTTSF